MSGLEPCLQGANAPKLGRLGVATLACIELPRDE